MMPDAPAINYRSPRLPPASAALALGPTLRASTPLSQSREHSKILPSLEPLD